MFILNTEWRRCSMRFLIKCNLLHRALACIWLIYDDIKIPHLKGEAHTGNSSYQFIYTNYIPTEFLINGIVSALLTGKVTKHKSTWLFNIKNSYFSSIPVFLVPSCECNLYFYHGNCSTENQRSCCSIYE